MTSRLRGRSLRPVPTTPGPPAAPAWMAARLAVAVLAAALLVALLEAAVLDVTVLQSPAGRPTATDRWHVVDVLAGGAVLAVPLTLLLGGWRLARGHAPRCASWRSTT